jgi:aryl-alcohol dehydrogenase-like predicted oxidoreductase
MSGSGLSPRALFPGSPLAPLGVSTGSTRWDHPSVTADDREILRGLRQAIELGASFIDTADSLGDGRAERLIGKVLRDYRHHKIPVISKVGRLRGSAPHPYAGPRVRHQLEQTLENLHAEDLGVYVLDSHDFGPGERYLSPVIGQLRAMRDLGQIQAIGLRGPTDVDSPKRIQRFLWLVEEIEPDVIWAQANGLQPPPLIEQGNDLCHFTARHGIGLVIASPLAHGLLAGQGNHHVLEALFRVPSRNAASIVQHGLRDLGDRFGHQPGILAQILLRARLQRTPHAVVAVGITDERRVRECFRCLTVELTDGELGYIEGVLSQIRLGIQGLACERDTPKTRVGGVS